MTLGRTSTGAIKIKTDSPGLRAVECACCQPPIPCYDCPPFFGDLNFSVSGDFSGSVQTFNFDPQLGPDGQTCVDSCDGYSAAGSGNGFATHGVTLRREYITGPDGPICGWVLIMGFTTQDSTTGPDGFPTECNFSGTGGIEISGVDPKGTYSFTLSGGCSGSTFDGSTFMENRSYNFTVVVS